MARRSGSASSRGTTSSVTMSAGIALHREREREADRQNQQMYIRRYRYLYPIPLRLHLQNQVFCNEGKDGQEEERKDTSQNIGVTQCLESFQSISCNSSLHESH